MLTTLIAAACIGLGYLAGYRRGARKTTTLYRALLDIRTRVVATYQAEAQSLRVLRDGFMRERDLLRKLAEELIVERNALSGQVGWLQKQAHQVYRETPGTKMH